MPHTPTCDPIESPAFESTKGDLERLCRLYGADPALLDDCTDLETFLDRAVRDRVASGSTSDEEGVRSLVALASRAALAQSPAADRGTSAYGAREQVERLVEVLEEVSVLSHKINNPLTAMLGRSQLLKAHGIEDEKIARAADIMSEAGQRLAELVRELAHLVKDARHAACHWLDDQHGGPSETP